MQFRFYFQAQIGVFSLSWLIVSVNFLRVAVGVKETLSHIPVFLSWPCFSSFILAILKMIAE